MPSLDLKTNAFAKHLLTGSSYPGTVNSASLHLAQWSQGAIISINILSIAVAACEFIVQTSPDDTTWTDHATYRFFENTGSVNSSRFMFLHPNKLGPYIRVQVKPGAGTIVGGGIAAVAVGSVIGGDHGVTYSVDTGA